MINWRRMLNVRATIVLALAVLLTSCSDDKVAGGTTEDAGLAIKNLDVAGLAQKGPFVKGSVVTLQGVDCKTMEFTDEVFKGSVINNDGEYVVENVSLSVACALLEVTGYYLNENTGKKSTGEISLHALTDLSDRKNVNINVFTELEYKRVMNLVTEKKMSFADAKKQAEKEVLAAFDVTAKEGAFAPFEDLNIFDEAEDNVALHDVSVMLQADLDATELAERLENIAADIAKDGKWDDRGSSSNNTKDSYLNPDIAYGEMTDSRDGQVYKTVKIGNQVWMAQNLNYADSVKTPSLKGKSWCYNNDPEKCAIAGRLYTWAAAIDSVKLATDKDNPVDCGNGKLCGLIGPLQGICPDGWLLPSEKEWSEMDKVVAGKAVQDTSGKFFKTTKGWSGDNNGTDVAGFSAMPAGYRYGSFISWGSAAYFWTSAEDNGNLTDWDYNPAIAHNRSFSTKDYYSISGLYKYIGMSVRCVKGESAPVFLEKEESPKATYLNPKIKYDSIVDSRDGKVYKTVKIGDQTWMAQNLSYKMNGRFCYKDSVKYCNNYGGLYLWSAAIGQFEAECDSKESCKIQGICPNGWHVPDTTEWSKLYSAVGRTPNAMQAKGFDYWPDATDDYGFSVIPAGNWFHDGFYNLGFTGDFWMSTRKDGGEPYYWDLDSAVAGFKTLISTQLRCSIRCIKDDDGTVPESSSSSVIPASSGNLPSSSSSLVNAYLNPDVVYSEMTDPRDGRVYKVAYIDRRFWMAENLDYADSVSMPSLKGRSWCYQNKPENCATMGRLYSWAAAIDSSKLAVDGMDCGAGKTCGLRGPVQGVCPDGWHLPTKVEWVDMWEAIAGNEAWNVAGSLLKSKTGWNNEANGSDDYGFSAAPAGFKAGAAYGYLGEYARFWSSTENEEAENGSASSNRNAYNVIYGLKDDPQLSGDNKAYGMSVRCVANDARLDWTVPKESYLNPDIDYGELTDSRDGQVYKTVKIGNQTWMAQNLNYADSVKTPSLKGNSWCFGDRPKRCNVGGRLYTWAAAIDSVGLAKNPDNPRDCGYNKECPFTESVHGICPDGWHLPSKAEFDTLVATVGGKEIAELNLRSRIGWSLYETGSDSYGFSAIPVGRRLNDKESGNVEYLFSGLAVDFWSSSERYTGTEPSPTMMVYVLRVYDNQNSSPVVIVGKGAGYSIRCLKD